MKLPSARFLALAAALLFLLSKPGANGAASFTEAVYATGLNGPVSMAWAPDGSGRLFVTEKNDGLRIVQNGTVQSPPFATFPELYTNSECGVLGLCFDPNYLVNRHVYVFVTVSAAEQRIVRFTDVISVGTERTNIMTGLPTLGANHDGGALGFGHDGRLYWAIGDNGAKRGVDQNLGSLASKVGRANPDGSVPADNPFIDGSGPQNDYIWATGFRNPFTMTFQPRTGQLWLNVVGSDPGGQTFPNSGPGFEQVFIVRAGDDGGYDDYEGNQPAGARFATPFTRPLLRPTVQYRTGIFEEGNLQRTVASIVRRGGMATVTTTSAHPFRVGQPVLIEGAGEASFNGTPGVLGVGSANTFVVPMSGADGATTGGIVRPFVIGSSIAGGVFYESSGFPGEYRGNFFFTDYTGGRVLRAVLDDQNRLKELSVFSTASSRPVDVAVGPDGALYVADNAAGVIRRIVSNQASSGLIVTPTIFNMQEGGQAQFAVRLGAAPTGEKMVNVRLLSGPAIVVRGQTLTFKPDNWREPQAVILAAPRDTDMENDSAVCSVESSGLSTQTVQFSVTDDALNTPLLSTNSLILSEGTVGEFAVSLPRQPAGPVTLTIQRSIDSAEVRVASGAQLTFTRENFAQPQRVRIAADEDANNSGAIVTFTVSSPGYTSRYVTVQALDNDPRAPVFKSTPPARAVRGLPYRHTLKVKGLPEPSLQLLKAPAGMTLNSATGEIEWTPAEPGEFVVKVLAGNGVAPDARQRFVLTVKEDKAPRASITAPVNGATISGANAEFFGNGLDDYGCFKAEFYVDNTPISTDANREGHFHVGGAHNLFNTTALSNGTHTLKMVVYDDKNQTGEATVQVTVVN